MGIGMSSGRQDFAGRTLPLLAVQMLLQYGPAGASRPPLTAALVYFRPGAVDAHLPRLQHVMFNPHLIIKFGDLRRFFLSAFYHLSEGHFYMNMASLLRTGVKLETSIGSPEFPCMVVSLLGLSQGFSLLLSKGLLLLGNDMVYYQYSAGFSGVLLGMNVVLNAREGNVVWHGVVVPAKYVALLELLLIHAFNPEAHLICNVGGILAGLAYLALRHGPERLAPMFSGIADDLSQPVRFAKRLLRSAANGPGSSVQRHLASAPREVGHGMCWRCITCSCDNSRHADVCEMCSTPHPDHDFSRRRHLQDGGNRELSVEEIRSRRLERFGG